MWSMETGGLYRQEVTKAGLTVSVKCFERACGPEMHYKRMNYYHYYYLSPSVTKYFKSSPAHHLRPPPDGAS